MGFVAVGKELGSQSPQSWGLTQWLQRGDHADMGWMADSRRLNILQPTFRRLTGNKRYGVF
ncbi:MAG: hypothetical protein LVT47_05325 [Cyanobacteria bacterium LVE1205-1]